MTSSARAAGVRDPVRPMVAAMALAGLVAACATVPLDEQPPPTDDPPSFEDQPAAIGSDDAFTAYGCPFRTLLPHDSRDTCAMRIIVQAFSGLTELDPRTGEPELMVAEEIETADSVTWSIRIADGWTFHNGEPVTARSFADAWNAAAHPSNEWRNAEFFGEIAGYDAIRAGEADTLAGVEVVDDLELEVTLSEPFAPFLAKLADPAFAPLPAIAFEDLDAYARQPIGNGRYEITGHDPDREVRLERYEPWPGREPGNAAEITFLIYLGDTAVQTAYQDVRAGALDVLDQIAPEHLTTVDEDLEGRVVRTPSSTFTFIGLPLDDSPYGASVQLRRALSLAIDREAIIASVFDGNLDPAASLIPPVLDAHRPDACEYCTFDPERAVELFEQAGGLDAPMTVYYNSGSGHSEWMAAIVEQWSDVLGIDDVTNETMDFASYLRMLERGNVAGPFRFAWALSYLSAEYALAGLFRSTGTSNYFGYSSDAFDDALDLANATAPEDADVRYQEAEDIVLEDLPVIPLWYGQSIAVHSPRVTDVELDATSTIRADRVAVVD